LGLWVIASAENGSGTIALQGLFGEVLRHVLGGRRLFPVMINMTTFD
jgi:hypothetical protein